MRKKLVILFTVFTGILSSQNNLSIDLNNKDSISLIGFSHNFYLDVNANYIQLTPIEMKLLNKSSYHIEKIDTVKNVKNGESEITINLILDKIKIKNSIPSDFVLTEVPLIVKYYYPSKKFEPTPPLFGAKLLKKSPKDSVSINSETNGYKLITKYVNSNNTITKPNTKQRSITNKVTSTKPTSNNNNIIKLNNTNYVKIIPCNTDHAIVYQKTKIQNLLNGNSNLKLEEELNIPPQAAINNVDFGITIRYFDDATKSDAEILKGEIESKITKSSVYTVDMQIYYNTPIQNYLEVWLK